MSSPQQPPPPDPQAAQAGLAVMVGLAIAKLWPSLDLLHLRESLPVFKAAVAHEVQRHAQASATLAARQYRQQRVAAGVSGGYTPIPAGPPPVEQVAQAVDWAVQPLWNADVLAHAEAGGSAAEAPAAPAAPTATTAPATPEAPSAASAIADAKARLAATAERQVLDAGRETIIDNAQRDRKARGWVRVPEPGACSFCLMLATRGVIDTMRPGGRNFAPMYTSETSAAMNQRSARHKTRAGEAFAGSGQFKAHDNCRCHVDPVFTAYEPTPQVREAQRLYLESTRGKSGAEARNAFRQAVEGRATNDQ